MPRRMPAFQLDLAQEVDRATQIALMGERVRSLSEPGSGIRRELSINRLEALYETAYLRLFLRWEDFLEQTFLRYLCGYVSGAVPGTLRQASFATIDDAEIAILHGRDFVSWADPNQVIARSQKFITNGVHELVINSDITRVRHFKSVRNRIAHTSEHARTHFDNATRALSFQRYPGSSPGRFLRDTATTIPPQSWLEVIGLELQNLAGQICS